MRAMRVRLKGAAGSRDHTPAPDRLNPERTTRKAKNTAGAVFCRSLESDFELLLLRPFVDVLDHVADRLQFLGIFVRNLDRKLFLKGHDELYDIEGIGSQIFNK